MLQMILFVGLILTWTCSPAQQVTDTPSYPYINSDLASLSVVIMKSKYDNEQIFKTVKSLEASVLEGRNNFYTQEGRGDLKFSFYPQKSPAPLIFLIADFADSDGAGYLDYEASLLHQNGFNVVTMPSPFFWNFILSSSKTGVPGMTDEDANDMYSAMQNVLWRVKQKHKYPITKIGVVGFGFGALEVAHISAIEGREKKLNIEKYLLINPVVNVLQAITQIETRVAIALEIGLKRVESIKTQAFNFVVDLHDDKYSANNMSYFTDLDKKFILTNKEYKFLTGAIFRLNIGDTVEASQLVNDLGVLKSKLSRNYRDARAKEAAALGIVGYLKEIFQPVFSKKYKPLEILKHSNFNYVRKDVLENQNMFLMHNQDDFLVDVDQLAYLREIFGPVRSKIYSYGGHLGNLWYPQNQSDVLEVLSSLK